MNDPLETLFGWALVLIAAILFPWMAYRIVFVEYPNAKQEQQQCQTAGGKLLNVKGAPNVCVVGNTIIVPKK